MPKVMYIVNSKLSKKKKIKYLSNVKFLIKEFSSLLINFL